MFAALVTTLWVSSAIAQTPIKDLETKGLKPLSGQELSKLLPGNTLYHINPANGVRVPLFYVPDGTRFVRIRGQVMQSNWKIEGDRVCEYSVVLKRDVCRSLYRFEGGGAVCDDGSTVCDYGLDWAQGNTEGLSK
jgi:hypothetical protein